MTKALFFLSLLLVSIPVLANEPTPIQREEAFVQKHGVAGSRFTTSAQISAEMVKVGKDLRDAVVAFDLKTCADPASASENDRAKALMLAMAVKTNGNKLGFLLIIHRRMYEQELAKAGKNPTDEQDQQFVMNLDVAEAAIAYGGAGETALKSFKGKTSQDDAQKVINTGAMLKFRYQALRERFPRSPLPDPFFDGAKQA